MAFCLWSARRLPTEAGWEYAARAGLEQKLFSWGNDLQPNGQHLCNVWQGIFPNMNTTDDGYAATCPVTTFPPNEFGLFSVTGNTWELCADRFSTVHETLLSRVNPKGPAQGDTRVLKGGSFLCHASYSNRYRVAARSASTPNNTASHIGFRCVAETDPAHTRQNVSLAAY
jgi:formylglycine-generating enzyme required for sulfatase activity